MDPSRGVDGTSGSFLPPRPPFKQKEIDCGGGDKDSAPTLKKIDENEEPHTKLRPSKITCPNFFRVARETLTRTRTLSDFIAKRTGEIEDSGNKNEYILVILRNSLEPDRGLKEAIEEELTGTCADLANELKDRLIASRSLAESAVLLKMLFVIGEQDNVISGVILPFIEEREGLGDRSTVLQNKEFFLRFFKALEREDLRAVLSKVNYHQVIRADNFGYALLDIAEPDFILDSLFENLENYTDLSEAEQLKWQEQIQMITLAILDKESTKEGMTDIEYTSYLEELYSRAVSKVISDKASTLLQKNCPRDAIAFYKDQISNDETNYVDRTDQERSRRCFAITHIAIAINDRANVIKILKEISARENDPAVVGTACKILASDLGEEGKEALFNLISEQVKGGQVSLPLACVSLLLVSNRVSNKRAYLEIMEDLLSIKYEKGKDLKKAYENLAELDLCPVSQDKNGLPFNLTSGKDPEMIVDVVCEIGLEKFLRQAFIDDVDSVLKQNLRNNSRSLLEGTSAPRCEEKIAGVFHYYLTKDTESEVTRLIRYLLVEWEI